MWSHHPHADELKKTGVLEAAALAARHVYRLVLIRYELFGKLTGRRILYLRKIGMARDQIEKRAGMNLQIRGRPAIERKVEFTETCERRQNLHRR
jgi:hypothetical protein